MGGMKGGELPQEHTHYNAGRNGIIMCMSGEPQPEMELIGSNVNEYSRCIDRIR